jgi:hypothetical protein
MNYKDRLGGGLGVSVIRNGAVELRGSNIVRKEKKEKKGGAGFMELGG